MGNPQWYESWFDTDYYHILYKNRDFKEAERFINNLVETVNLPPHSKVLDLACGKGRHSVTLFTHGYNVLGVDLSPQSIDFASYLANDNLQFMVHDMREAIEGKQFDAVFNLFTSFGYFDSHEDNKRVLDAVHTMLKPKGILVIDFMNAVKEIARLVPTATKTNDGITFHLTKKFDNHHIYKYIDFETDGQQHHYMERVQALKLSDFQGLFNECGFDLLHTFGNFDLDEFDETTSDRLILIAQKK